MTTDLVTEWLRDRDFCINKREVSFLWIFFVKDRFSIHPIFSSITSLPLMVCDNELWTNTSFTNNWEVKGENPEQESIFVDMPVCQALGTPANRYSSHVLCITCESIGHTCLGTCCGEVWAICITNSYWMFWCFKPQQYSISDTCIFDDSASV